MQEVKHTAAQLMWKYKKPFIVLFSIMYLLIATVVFLLPKRYESKMKLLVNNGRQELVVSPGKEAGAAARPDELSETEVNSEIELLRSRDVLKDVVLTTGLNKGGPGTVIASGEPSPVAVAEAIDKLDSKLDVAPIKKTDVIEVAYSSRSPELAYTVMRRLASTYLEAHLKVHGTPGTYAFFEVQSSAYKSRLDDAERRLQAFRERYSSLVLPEERDYFAQRAIEAQGLLEDADAQAADYTQRVQRGISSLGNLQPRVVTQLRTVPQAGLTEKLSEVLADLRNRRTELLTKFKPNDRLVKEVDQEISDTNQELQNAAAKTNTEQNTDVNSVRQSVERDVLAAETTLAGLEARRARLREIVNGYKQGMYELAGTSIQHDALVREVKENEDNYLLYANKREEARIEESLNRQRITNVAVVEAPSLPAEPAGPKIPLDLALGAVVSALFAYAVIKLALEFAPGLLGVSHGPQVVREALAS